MARLRTLLFPALFTLLVGALLVGLGIWQLHRLAWKTDLLAKIDARATSAPQPLPPMSVWGRLAPGDYDYRRVALDGVFDNSAETYVFRGSEEGPGYLVITPLHLAGGGTVLVNRGFVPDALKDRATRRATEPSGRVRVVGLMRPAEARNLFTPADEPLKSVYFTRDPAPIAVQLGLHDAAPFLVDAEAGPDPRVWPHGGQTLLAIPNNHLSYALTWFGLALGLLGVFLVQALRTLRGASDDAPKPAAMRLDLS